MNMIFNSINSVEPAFLFCNDAIYIRIQLLVVLSINCRFPVLGPKNYLVIYLAVTAHGMYVGWANFISIRGLNPWLLVVEPLRDSL